MPPLPGQLPQDFLAQEGPIPTEPPPEEEGWEVFETPEEQAQPPQEALVEEPEPTPQASYPEGELADLFINQMATFSVVSSNVRDITYDKKNQLLYVTYKNGKTYEYGEIDPDLALAFFNVRNNGDQPDPDIPCGYAGHPDKSPGHQVWDKLRIRGTKTGHQKPWKLVT
jgi:hypothetical protein